MRIGVFHNLPSGGAKRVIYEEIKELSKKYELILFRLKETDENIWDMRPYTKKIFEYDFNLNKNNSYIFRRADKDFNNFILLANIHKRIASDIRKSKCDVCLVHPDIYTQAPYLLKYLRIPSVYYCHELLRNAYEIDLRIKSDLCLSKRVYENVTRKIRKFVDKKNSEKADVIIVNSELTARKVNKAYNKDAFVCYPGVDTKIFRLLKKKKRNKLVFIGRSKEKIDGYDLAFESTNNVKNNVKNKMLNFYSLFPKKEKLRLTDKDLSKIYSESLLTLCTSRNEPFGLTAIESMACETPVLAVNEGGYKETVVDGITGYLLPRDPKIFAEKIEFLMKNPKIARKMGKAGREHVKKNFTWEKHNQKLEKILLEYAKKKQK